MLPLPRITLARELNAHRRVEPVAAAQDGERKAQPEDDTDDEGVEGQRVGIGPAAGAEGAGDGRRDPAAHGAARHHLHQHQDREDEGDAGQRVGAELADKVCLDESHRRLHQHHQHVRGGEAQQGARDRGLQEHPGPRVEPRARSRPDNRGIGSRDRHV